MMQVKSSKRLKFNMGGVRHIKDSMSDGSGWDSSEECGAEEIPRQEIKPK